MRIIRWLLVLPFAVAGWYLGLLAGLLVYQIGESTCPTKYIVSGFCTAPWSHAVYLFALAFGAGMAGAAVVALPTLVAPEKQIWVAAVALILGIVAATYMLFTTTAWLPFVAALICGSVSLWLIKRNL
jgi:MFS family permease